MFTLCGFERDRLARRRASISHSCRQSMTGDRRLRVRLPRVAAPGAKEFVRSQQAGHKCRNGAQARRRKIMHCHTVPMPPGRSRWSPATRSLPVTYTRVPPTGVCGGAGSRAGSSRYRPIFSPFADQPIHCAGAGLYRRSAAQQRASNRNRAWMNAGVRCRHQFGWPLGHVDARLRAKFLIKKAARRPLFSAYGQGWRSPSYPRYVPEFGS
jgi:hypothetical protein